MMKSVLIRMGACGLLVVAWAACSDDTKAPTPDMRRDQMVGDMAMDTKTAPDKPKTEASTDKGKGEAKPPDAAACAADSICGSIVDFLAQTTPVTGVQVCEKGKTTGCGTTDAKGAYTVGLLPLTTDFALSVTKTGYVTALMPFGKGQTDRTYNLALPTTTALGVLAGVLGTTVQAGKGLMILSSIGTTGYAAGTSVTLDVTGGEGPYYVADTGLPDKALKETSSKGIAAIVNLAPGTYNLSFKNSKGLTCTRYHGWEGATAGTIKAEVVADAMTVVQVLCK